MRYLSAMTETPRAPFPIWLRGDFKAPFEPSAKCDACGAIGALDFIGDRFCPKCVARFRRAAVSSKSQMRRHKAHIRKEFKT